MPKNTRKPNYAWMNLPTVSEDRFSRAQDSDCTFGVSRRRADKIRKELKRELGISTEIALPGKFLLDLVFKSSRDKAAAVDLIYRRYQFEFDADHWQSY
jgi:hypothetical protein